MQHCQKYLKDQIYKKIYIYIHIHIQLFYKQCPLVQHKKVETHNFNFKHTHVDVIIQEYAMWKSLHFLLEDNKVSL